MPDLWVDVDTAVVVPVNILPLLDDTDFKSIEPAVVYNSAGLALTWNFQTSTTYTAVACTPTTGDNTDWGEPVANQGMYSIEIPASGGGTINNDTEGVGWFTGVATGVLPWRGPTIGFRRAALNDLFRDGGTASTNMEDFFDGTGYAGGTAKLTVDVTKIGGQTTTAAGAVAVAGYVGTAAADTVATVTAVTNGVTLAADAITAAKIADDAFSSEHFATDCLTDDAVADSFFDVLADDTDVAVAVAANVTIAAAIADVAAILVDTGTTIPGTITTMQANVTDILTDTGTTLDDFIDSEIATLVTEVGKIPKSDSTVSWNATALAAIQTECNDALIANNLDHLALTATAAADMTTEVADNTIISRIIGNGDTSTFVPSTDGLHAAGVDLDATIAAVVTNAAGTDVAADIIAAKTVIDNLYTAVVTNAAGTDIAADIIALKAETVSILEDTGTTIPATLAAFATTADIADAVLDEAIGAHTGVIADIHTDVATLTTTVGAAGVGLTAVALANGTSDAVLADAIWNAAASSYGGSGTYGQLLEDAGTGSNPWSTALPGAYGAGTAGYILGTNLAAVYGATEKAAIDLLDDANGLVNIHDTVDIVAGYLDTEVAAILADTNELQTDWANGGRLDLLLDTASAAGDPWGVAIPGAYGAGTAGLLLGTTIPAAIDTIDNFLDTEIAAITTAVITDAAGTSLGADTTEILTRLPDAVPGAAGGVFIAGTNAAVTITSATADALTLSATGADKSGLVVAGNGSGAGATITAGATGKGLTVASSGITPTVEFASSSSGTAFSVVSADGPGMSIASTNAGGLVVSAADDGVLIESNTAGNGITITTTDGEGISVNAGGSESYGIYASGPSAGVRISGETTGDGLVISGGGTSGNGITVTATDGDGIEVTGAGSGHVDVDASITDLTTLITTVGAAGAGLTAVGLAADAITSAKIADNAFAAEHFAAACLDNATFAADVGTTALASNPLAQAAAKGAHDSLVASHVIASTFGKYLGGAPAGATVSADIAAVKAETAAIFAGTVTNATGADVCADIIALRTVADTIAADTTTDIPALIAASDAKLDTIDNFLDTEVAAILADTNELQVDWTNGGRLDVILDAVGAAPTAAAIADAVWDEVVTGHDGAGKAGAQLWTDLDAVLADTNELEVDWKDGGRLDLLLDGASALAEPWLTTLPGAYAEGTAGYIIGTNLAAVYGSTEKAAIDLLDDANGLVNIHDTVDTIATNVVTTMADVAAVHVHAGNIEGTVNPGLQNVANAVTSIGLDVDAILADTGTDGVLLAAAAVDAIWDEDVNAAHQTADTAGKKLDDAGAAADPWTTLIPGGYTAGMAGKIVGDNLNAPIATVDTVVDTLATELAKVPKSDSTVTWNATALASMQAEATDALNAYDPPTKGELDTGLAALPTAATTVAALLDHDYTDHTTTGTVGKWMNAIRTLLGHKSVENEAGDSVSYKATDDTTESGTMSWGEASKTRGRYTGW